MNKSRALILSIASGLVIACSILIGVLIYMLAATITDGWSEGGDNKYEAIKAMSGPYWLVAIVYGIPATFSFMAAFVQNKCLYIVCCIISLIAVAIMGLAIFIFGYPIFIICFGLYKINENCADVNNMCECYLDDNQSVSLIPFKECSYMDDVVNLFIAVSCLIVVAWFFLVVTFIITIVFACRSKQTAGTVYTPAQQPMLTH